MRHPRTRLVSVALAAALAAPAARAIQPAAAHPAGPAEKKKEVLFEARPPPFSDGIFPCMECHKDQKDPKRRELAFHDEQQSVFDHDAEHRWCLDCHDLAEPRRAAARERRDRCRSPSRTGCAASATATSTATGAPACTGSGSGCGTAQKTYLLCVSATTRTRRAFKGVKEIVVDGKVTVAPTLEMIEPEPRPRRPEEMRRRSVPRRPADSSRKSSSVDPGRRGRAAGRARSARRAAPSCAPRRRARRSRRSSGCGVDVDDFFRKHFKELSKDELAKVLAKDGAAERRALQGATAGTSRRSPPRARGPASSSATGSTSRAASAAAAASTPA